MVAPRRGRGAWCRRTATRSSPAAAGRSRRNKKKCYSNTYTAPLEGAALLLLSPFTPVALLSSKGAANTSVESDSAAELRPNLSLASELDALTYNCCDQFPEPLRTNRYPAPAPGFVLSLSVPPIPVAPPDSFSADTASQSPESATA